MKDLLKDIKETSTAEKFWTSILLLLWIGVLCYSFTLFVILQLIFPFLIILFVGDTEFKEEDNRAFLWLFTSVFVVIIFLIINLTDEVGKIIKINPIKKFNDWLNSL